MDELLLWLSYKPKSKYVKIEWDLICLNASHFTPEGESPIFAIGCIPTIAYKFTLPGVAWELPSRYD